VPSSARSATKIFLLLVLALLSPVAAMAHVGSPDVYADGQAGPYKLFVTVRPPPVIPGVAEIEVRSETPGIDAIEITPIPLTGVASLHAPVADPMKHSSTDKQFFTGALWIMSSGSWQIRFTVNGAQGAGVLSIPVPATASSTRGMTAGLGILLGVLGLVLVAGVIGIVGAAARDAQLPPGAVAPPAKRRNAMIAMSISLVLLALGIWGGNHWWNGEASDYAQYVYKPLTMSAALNLGADTKPTLALKIQDPGWIKSRRVDDFVLDHEHLMHLYLVRQPGLDLVYHLHPEQVSPGEFELKLPSVEAGNYALYADVVHATGFPETLVTSLALPEITGRPLAGDDAKGRAAALNAASCVTTARATLPDGETMVWNRPAVLKAKAPEIFSFSLLDGTGKPSSDVTLYMGMLGHAAFIKSDGSVFAHVHPSGTGSMTALMMAAAQNEPGAAQAAASKIAGGTEDDEDDESAKAPKPAMGAMMMKPTTSVTGKLPNTVGFPYGFPTPGAYRIFVQMKHGETIETAPFDACVQ
jgi:hypothetical protein